MATQERIEQAKQRLTQIRQSGVQAQPTTTVPTPQPTIPIAPTQAPISAPTPALAQIPTPVDTTQEIPIERVEQARQRLVELRKTPTPPTPTGISRLPAPKERIKLPSERPGVQEEEKVKKGILGFGETLGTALATRKVIKTQEAITKVDLEQQPQILRQLRDPKISVARKQRIAKLAGMDAEFISKIPQFQKTGKDIAAEALGTLATVALPGAPGAGLAGRLALGAGIGAATGVKRGLEEDETTGQIIKRGAIGAGIGLAAGGAFEGLGAGVRLFGSSPLAKRIAGAQFTRTLKPPTKDLTRQLEFNLATTGERVAQATDDVGKPLFFGGSKQMKQQAQRQIVNKGKQLDDVLQKDFGNVSVTRTEIKKSLLSKLEDDFGVLTTAQKKTIDKELLALPKTFDLKKANTVKRTISDRVPSGFWLDPNSQRAFVGNTRYQARQVLKEVIENKADTTIVKRLNNEMGLALDVRHLAATQQAIAQKALPFNLQTPNLISGILSRTIFSPKLTTRGAQLVQGRLPAGLVQARPIRGGIIQAGTQQLNR